MRRGCPTALALAVMALNVEARADGVAQVMTSKSIPEATVALIDPESGTSSGGGTTDVKVAVGDIVLFRFKYFPVPDKIVRGLAGYLTEYVPANTEVVGVRIIDADGLTIPPRYPGIAPDGCARTCNGFNAVPSASGNRNLDDGSISQVYADTGVFYATAATLARNPTASFITLQNGIVMSPEPRNVGAITGLLGAASPLHAHNAWDWTQVRAFGINNAQGNASGNGGTGNTPHLYGSPVAGAETHYRYEATEVMPGVIQFNDVVGPWRRIRHLGSQIGAGAAVTSGGSLQRTNVATSLGHDITPANPLPSGTRAVRFALGEARVGEPGFAEIALRVKGTPLDPGHNKDADCGEVFGGDTSAASDSVRARDNHWPTYLASPACVFLNLLFDLDVDKALARTGDVLTYTLRGKNLSLNPQTSAVAKLKYDSNDASYVPGSGTGGPTVVSNCDGDAKTCLVWPTQNLSPSAEYVHTAKFTVGGGGHVTNVMFANYRSDQLPAPGFTTQALTVIREIGVVKATLAPASSATAGGTVAMSGTLANTGSGPSSMSTVTILLPSGWSVTGPVTLAGAPLTCSSGCGTHQPVYNLGASFAAGESRALSFGVSVPGGTAAGLFDVDLQIWGSQAMFGGAFETYFPQAARVAVGASRSSPPVVNCPIVSGATSISGTTTSPSGTTIRVYFNGISRGTGTSAGGQWTVSNYGSFGSLYGGLEVRATAQAPGQLESELSLACFVAFAPVCSDGNDNDSDGLADFPGDPGCDSPSDSDERDAVTQCSDGADNDGDGLIDLADNGCGRPGDSTETGSPECSDGIDNDGDGKIDSPADPGCSGATDATEVDRVACQDGLDNDSDGKIDFPADPGCHSGFDTSEADPAFTPATVRPRLLVAFDTSGSMNNNTCREEFTGGDGSSECPGADVACATCAAQACGDGLGNDSRLHKVKAGISNVVRAFGEVDFGLMRFHQRAETFSCPTTSAGLRSGGWQGGGAAPCGGGFDAGDLLVSFDQGNRLDLLSWMDGASNYSGTPPPGLDWELRGSGTTPIAGILRSALQYLQPLRAGDARGTCRPYRVVLVTDGAETCGGDPRIQAAALLAAGIKVHVIGFATSDPSIVASLNAIAAAGGTGQAVRVEDQNALSAAISSIINESILIERCNDLDDDCDTLVDEDFPDKGDMCSNDKEGACFKLGTRVCSPDGLGTMCNAPDATPGTEVCPPNRIDDDCNGIIDDIPGGCPMCLPEVCNGLDDDCDNQIDEPEDLFPCPGGMAGVCAPMCGTGIGECRPGVLACVAGRLECAGSVAPATEVCDGKDNDCNTVIDGFTRACYPAGTAGCDLATKMCIGNCRLGAEICARLDAPAASNSFAPCRGAITPQKEICNGLDDDCNGVVDEVPGGCERICIPKAEICNGLDDNCNAIVDDNVMGEGDACVEGYDPMKAGIGECRPGRKTCSAGTFRCIGPVGPQPEICDGKDNDCNGDIDVNAPCPVGFLCVAGACQPLCKRDEFPCNVDRVCVAPQDQNPCQAADRSGCVCLPNLCVQAACDGTKEDCRIVSGKATCMNRCEAAQCPDGVVCDPRFGTCLDCYRLGCASGEICTGTPGRCQADPCAAVSCAAGELCQGGVCRASCRNVRCGGGEMCVQGQCQVNRCQMVSCSTGQVCNPETGSCQVNLCPTRCPMGQSCLPSTGQCVADACLAIRCPACSLCQMGFDGTPDCVPDPSCREVGTISLGGSGCACAVTAPARDGRSHRGGILPVILFVGLMLRRRDGMRKR